MECTHKDFTPLKKEKATPSAADVMASTFWDSRGVLFTNFLTEQQTSNAVYYS
jgi:hypothetical protein